MLPHKVVLSLACLVAFGFAAPLISEKDAKTGMDDDTEVKISLEKLKFIPKELLCSLCYRVVGKLQHDLREDPVQFQINMLKSCDNYPDLEDQVKCRAAFTNRQKIEQLMDPEAAPKMCLQKQMCKPGEKPLPLENFPVAGPAPLPNGVQSIPPVAPPMEA
uniref:Saposin B-type domain-containing protein n=1 Tax=Panagrellus redivivus TaxID=6233 RepID=A0A7E4ZR11_PANRE